MALMFGECHAHIILNGTNYHQAINQHKNGVDSSTVARKLETYADAGITFIRDGGDALGVSAYAKKIAGDFGIDYRTPLFAIHKKGHYGDIVGKSFSTLQEYAQLVAQAKAQGADFIKIMTTGIMDFSNFGVITGDDLTRHDVTEMVHIAREEGLAVMSHTNGAQAVLTAVQAGVKSIEHGNYLNDECFDAMIEHQCVYVPTATVARNLIGSGMGDDKVLSKIWNTSKENIARALEKDVPVALGSDAGAVGVMHAQGVFDEYDCFHQAADNVHNLEKQLQAGQAFIETVFQRH